MARISGIDLPRDKRIEVALTYIYGIGPARAAKVLEVTGIDPDIRVKDLTEEQEAKLRVRSAAIAACVIAAACLCTASGRRPTPVPARVPRRPLQTRRSKEGYVNGC